MSAREACTNVTNDSGQSELMLPDSFGVKFHPPLEVSLLALWARRYKGPPRRQEESVRRCRDPSTQHSTRRNFVRTKQPGELFVAFGGRYKLDDRTVSSMRPTTGSVARPGTGEILPVFWRPYVPPRDTSLPDLRAYRGGSCQMCWVVKLDFNRWSCISFALGNDGTGVRLPLQEGPWTSKHSDLICFEFS